MYKPLTPDFRRQIDNSIDNELRELDHCNGNAFVSVQKIGLQAFRNLLKALPDGYPIPVEKDGN